MMKNTHTHVQTAHEYLLSTQAVTMTTKRKGKERKEEIHNKCDQKYFSLIRHHEKHVVLLVLEFVHKDQ